MSKFCLIFGVVSHLFINIGRYFEIDDNSIATDIGPSQYSTRSTNLDNLSTDATVNRVISFLFWKKSE